MMITVRQLFKDYAKDEETKVWIFNISWSDVYFYIVHLYEIIFIEIAINSQQYTLE